MRKVFVLLALVALAAPASALAGGTATAGLSPPEGVGAGDTWNAQVKILQHGETPLVGVSPTVTIRNESTGAEKTFAAKATGEPGIYMAKVVFPSSGKWSYAVYDGFTEYGGAQTHSFGAVSIGSGSSGESLPFFAIIGIGLLAFAAVAVIYLLARRVRVRAPAPSH